MARARHKCGASSMLLQHVSISIVTILTFQKLSCHVLHSEGSASTTCVAWPSWMRCTCTRVMPAGGRMVPDGLQQPPKRSASASGSAGSLVQGRDVVERGVVSCGAPLHTLGRMGSSYASGVLRPVLPGPAVLYSVLNDITLQKDMELAQKDAAAAARARRRLRPSIKARTEQVICVPTRPLSSRFFEKQATLRSAHMPTRVLLLVCSRPKEADAESGTALPQGAMLGSAVFVRSHGCRITVAANSISRLSHHLSALQMFL